VGSHFLIFLGVAAIVIVVPGPDTALVTKNAALHGRRAALGTAFGVCTGLSVWTVASALGVASLVRASAAAYTTLKLIGAAYLIWLGVEALRAARRAGTEPEAGRSRRALDGRGGFRQGVLSDLANPKIGVFFTSLIPQFVGGHAVLVPFLLLGGTFVVMTLAWLSAYAVVAAKASALLARPRIKAALDRITGLVLIALGLRLATER
jgi:RhtB (resistance to homoserine/threonine) family protein